MAQNFNLTQTGEEVQQILDTATPITDLQQEASSRQQADTTLQDNIDSEASARQGADTTLQGNIEAEAAARQQAIEGLAQQIALTLNNYYQKSETMSAQEIQTLVSQTITAYYTKLQVNVLIQDFITKSVNDLTNYYLKTETFTKTEVQQLIAAVKQFRYQSVPVLPTASAETMNIIYLVPSANPKAENVKDEFITTSQTNEQGVTTYDWEQIGSTTVDLSGYSTTEQMNAAISQAISTALNTALTSYYTKTETNGLLDTIRQSVTAETGARTEADAALRALIQQVSASLVNYYLKSETYSKTEVNALIAAVKQFRYQSVPVLPTASAETMNIIYLVPSANPKAENVKDEFITTSQTNEQGVTTYDWEQIGSTTVDLSGYSTTEQMNAAISQAISTALNTALTSYYTKTETNGLLDTIRQSVTAETGARTEADAALRALIQQVSASLVNYYLKSETYSKTEVNALVAAIKQFQYQVVATLPETPGPDTMGIIYLVPSTNPKTQNVKDEFITVLDGSTYKWEQIGSTTVDLSGYSTTAEMNAAIAQALTSYYTKTQVDEMVQTINTALGNRYTKGETDGLLAGKQAVITDGAQVGLGYGTSSDNANVQARTATLQNFIMLKNMPVSIRFTTAISADNATLNINSQGAKPLFIQGAALQAGVVKAGDVVTLIYDGTNWNIIDILTVAASQSGLFVDMGLPSGLRWAIANLDATTQSGFAEVDGKPSPFKYEGTFFSWGNTEGHNPISESAFSYDWGTGNDGPYAQTPGAQLTANAGLSFDAARAILGAPWRDPSTDDFAELFNSAYTKFIDANGDDIAAETTNKLVTISGIVGIRLKSIANGNIIFFPCSGNGRGQSWNYRGSYGSYWSRSLYSQTNGRSLDFYSGGVYPQSSSNRFYGVTRRAVQ